jgi:hypothetical protein
MKDKIEIEEIAVVTKLTDGSVRQILTDTKLNDMIISLIRCYNNKISVTEETIDTIEILTKKKD